MLWLGLPVVDTVITTGVSPQNEPSKYTSPYEGMEFIEKYPWFAPGSAGSVAGTASVTGKVETMAEDTATVAASSNTIVRTIKDRMRKPPSVITENAVVNYFKLPIHSDSENPEQSDLIKKILP
jgi:hypothetical protein